MTSAISSGVSGSQFLRIQLALRVEKEVMGVLRINGIGL
jgi:hypothetical protein